jgi:hypothetical protein
MQTEIDEREIHTHALVSNWWSLLIITVIIPHQQHGIFCSTKIIDKLEKLKINFCVVCNQGFLERRFVTINDLIGESN